MKEPNSQKQRVAWWLLTTGGGEGNRQMLVKGYKISVVIITEGEREGKVFIFSMPTVI